MHLHVFKFFFFLDSNGLEFDCCKLKAMNQNHPLCMPIEIPINDPFYSAHGQTCVDFKRSLAGHRPNCALGNFFLSIYLFLSIDKNYCFSFFFFHFQVQELISTH